VFLRFEAPDRVFNAFTFKESSESAGHGK
jgi:hypothetical protein